MGNKFRDKAIEDELVAPSPAAPAAEPAVADTATAASPTQDAKPKRGRKAIRSITKVLGGDILADGIVLKQIPLLLLCLLYLLLLVGNRYRIESLSIDKQATEERINYLREQRIQMQKQYQQSVKISQIATDLKERGVGITAGPPYQLDKR